MDRQTALSVLDKLYALYGDTACALDFENPFQLLVAVILSAQCTDKRVNSVTEKLFKIYRTPADFAALSEDELIPHIYSCGYYNNKSKSIIGAARAISEKHGGNVPSDYGELCALPGVGRKTANVMTSVAFGGEAIAVDTHVFRVANRLGMANSPTPERTERDLTALLPREAYTRSHFILITHGREICKSRKPLCAECPVAYACAYFQKELQ